MAITIEEMKEMIVDNEIDYIKNMIKNCDYEELSGFVYVNCFSNFKSMSAEEIKEQYEWRYNIFEEEKI